VEPAMVICITDGSKLSSQGGIQDEVITFLKLQLWAGIWQNDE